MQYLKLKAVSIIDIRRVLGILAVSIMKGRCMPLKWDRESRRFYLYQKQGIVDFDTKVEWEKVRISAVVRIHLGASLMFVGQVIFPSPQESKASTSILSWIGLVMTLGYHTYLRFCRKRCDMIASLLNGLLEFADTFPQHWHGKHRSITENVNILMALFLPPTALVVPTGLSFGLHWFNPYKPTLIGYWALKVDWSFRGFVTKIGILIFNYWFWTVGVLSAVACAGCVQMLSTILLRDCIHTFWNMEMIGNIPFLKKAETYRQVQLLGCLQNEVQSGSLLTILMVGLIMIVPLNLVVIICEPWAPENLGILLLCGYLTFCSIICTIFILGGLAGLWSDSRVKFERLDRTNVSRHVRLRRKEWKFQQKFWKSCRNLIKVKFGVNNYVEEETPLNCLNCSLSLAVQLLLLGD